MSKDTVYRWEAGTESPSVANLLTWIAELKLDIALKEVE